MKEKEFRNFFASIKDKVSMNEGVLILAKVNNDYYWGGCGGTRNVVDVIMQALHEDEKVREMILNAVEYWKICERKSGFVTGNLDTMPKQIFDAIANEED